jgi:pyruvate,water dikinase
MGSENKMAAVPWLCWFDEVGLKDIDIVGGKAASLGEMISHLTPLGIAIPSGFVITTQAYDAFISENNLLSKIRPILESIDYKDFGDVKRKGHEIRRFILESEIPRALKSAIQQYYQDLSDQYGGGETDVAVRSSGTAEDMPNASFAGQQDTYLNIKGTPQLFDSIKKCFASLYTDRSICYRKHMGYDEVKIAVCVQKMVRSDLACSGVAFSIDTETGSPEMIVINGSWGLGELIVGGGVNPDEYMVFKPKLKQGYHAIIDKKLGSKETRMVYAEDPLEVIKEIPVEEFKRHTFCLQDEHILQLSRWVVMIEDYYSRYYGRYCPMDTEWAVDGKSQKLFIVQARAETVHANKAEEECIENFHLRNKGSGILRGTAVGDKIGQGRVKIIQHLEEPFEEGEVLVTSNTDPDWEPIMKKASAIITDKGGRTCHSAIVARELGIPAIVGTGNGTSVLTTDQEVTVSCCEGEIGYVYAGRLEVEVDRIKISDIPQTTTKIMMNIATPEKALTLSKLPHSGVGLAREEFIINNFIKAHPLALLKHHDMADEALTQSIRRLVAGYESERDYFIRKLSYGIARIASAFYPHDVIVRFSDFKSNEYYNMLGGNYFEPQEENPMIGWRGASRYYSQEYEEAFGLECMAIKKVREEIGLDNVIVMIPFCRTIEECKKVLETMATYGLVRGENGLQVYLMCEIPSNVILAKEFASYVDGFSIGSNDLTQLVLGVDRDSSLVSHVYDERNSAVKTMIGTAIKACHQAGIKIGICGQAPSDFPEFAQFLVEQGIDSISVTPDSIYKTLLRIASLERQHQPVDSL